MKYLLFNWDNVNEDIDSPTNFSDEKFEQLAVDHGVIFNSCQEFEDGFNEEDFSTTTHQLRILDN